MAHSLNNVDVRMDIRRLGFTQYRVSQKMNVSESYLSRLLRDPLSEEDRRRIYSAIDALQNE